VVVPKSIDSGAATDLGRALAIDAVLLGLFAVQHSVMARSAFKRWWTTIIPHAAERSTYVLLSSLALFLLFWQWQPIAYPIWQLEGTPAGLVLTEIYWGGWLIAFVSTFLISHFDLFSLRQALSVLRGTSLPKECFKTALLYKVARHPIMPGFILAFWATPTMTAGHLLFATMTTGYILVALRFEKKDLSETFGASYGEYRARVPMIVPFWPKRRLFKGEFEIQ